MKQHWKILIAFGIFGLLLGVGRAAFEDSFGKLSTVSVIIFTLVVDWEFLLFRSDLHLN